MPSSFKANTASPSDNYAALLWAGLTPRTRKSYEPAVRSFEHFCRFQNQEPWPANESMLGQWVVIRTFGSSDHLMSQLKPATITSYLSALRSHHIDRRIDTTVFDSPHLLRLVQGARGLFPSRKRERLPVTRDILSKITPPPTSRNDYHIDAAFKLAFAGFLRMGEFTHTHAKEITPSFKATGLTRSDLTLSTDHAIVRLKRSKTDKMHQGVNILVASTGDSNCPVQALKDLLQTDPQPPSVPLFRLEEGGFPREALIKVLKSRLQTAGIPSSHYSGHSFRKGAAQHAKDNGLLDEHIQQLGRWSSNAFRLYFKTPQSELYRLNRAFQTGESPRFSIS